MTVSVAAVKYAELPGWIFDGGVHPERESTDAATASAADAPAQTAASTTAHTSAHTAAHTSAQTAASTAPAVENGEGGGRSADQVAAATDATTVSAMEGKEDVPSRGGGDTNTCAQVLRGGGDPSPGATTLVQCVIFQH